MLERLKNNFKNYFSKAPKAAFIIALLLIICSIAIINAKKTVVIDVDGKSQKVTTLRRSVSGALKDGNIKVDTKDKIMPGAKAHIEDGDKITIKKAVNVAVQVDNKEIKIKSAENSVAKMLKAEKISLDEDDKIVPSKDDQLKSGMKIVITRVDARVETKNETLDFKTVVQNDDNLERGVNKTVQEGSQGNKKLSYKVVYENGKEVYRKVVEEVITKNPVDKIVAAGTLGVVKSNRGEPLYYNNSIEVKATAYSSSYSCTGKHPGDYGFGVTATGTQARRNSEGYSSVAVDPRVIPLGTKLYIPGYGAAIAEDVGGGVKGNSIDLYFDTDSQADNWGVRWITVYILKK